MVDTGELPSPHPGAATEMFTQRFWMCHFGLGHQKRTVLWSTSSALAAFGIFSTMSRKDFQFDEKKKTTERYRNKQGELAYKGSKHLKSTQFPGLALDILYVCKYLRKSTPECSL